MCLKKHMITQMIGYIYVHCYRNKAGKQSIDFLKKVDKRYDEKNIQNTFLVFDNLSMHKSKMVKKEEISKRCLRIKFLFLPVRCPELNLIEVEDGCGHKDKQLTILHSKMSKK
jgi:hypothetical protein